MEKVKLTMEQAEAIGDVITYGTKEEAVESHIEKGWRFKEYLCLNALSTDEFIRAIYIGYEVEETFEAGDWVKVNWRDKKPSIHKVRIVNNTFVIIDGEQANTEPPKRIIEHATSEEIAEEKQRRWWAKHGREVWELREGDLLERLNDMKIIEFLGFDQGALEYRIRSSYYREYREDILGYEKRYRVVCFAEDRKDVK